MGLPKIPVFCPVLFYICGRNEFSNFATKELVKIPIMFPKKSNLGTIKVIKGPKLNLQRLNRSLLQLKSIANYIKYNKPTRGVSRRPTVFLAKKLSKYRLKQPNYVVLGDP